MGSIPGWGRSPGGGHGNPLHYSHLENPHGQRSLAGYSSRGHGELDMTEVTAHTHTKGENHAKMGTIKDTCRLLDRSHSDWCEMVPHSGFDLHFSDNE